MVVNREGDLELYAVHDTPKQALWSARGDFAIGAGQSYRILAGFHEDQPPPEPWDVQHQSKRQHTNLETASNSHSGQLRAESVVRGRGRTKPNTAVSTPALFGRGDEDGFPALTPSLNAPQPSGKLVTEKSGKSTLSSRSHHLDSGAKGVDAGDRPHSRTRLGTNYIDRLPTEASRRQPRSSDRDKTISRSRKQLLKNINYVVEDDISMIMRRRTIRGYGLNRVRNPLYY
jgi:hypothetical protein